MVMRFYSYFEDVELANADSINEQFPVEIGQLIMLFDVLNGYLDKVNGKIKTDQYPEHTVLNFSAQNLQLINNAYILFTQGYFRSPAALLRTVSEHLILSMYFVEYPDKEAEYRSIHHSDFFNKNAIEKMLSKIDREGKVFRIASFKKYNFWNKTIYKNLFEELCYFVHPNVNIINNLMFDEVDGKYHKGPRLQDHDLLCVLLRKIFECLVYSILILDKTFKPEQTSQEIEVIKKSTEMISSRLNVKPIAK